MWTKNYLYKLINYKVTDKAATCIRSSFRTGDKTGLFYAALCKRLIRETRTALEQALTRIAVEPDTLTPETAFYCRDRFDRRTIAIYRVDPLLRIIGYIVLIYDKSEQREIEKLYPMKTWYMLDDKNSVDSNMPDVLPASKPQEDEDDEEQS